MAICTLVGFWAGGVVLRLLWFWLWFDLFVGFADLCAGGLAVGCGWLCCLLVVLLVVRTLCVAC